MENNVVIIGNDHINTLGLIRTFGENGVNPYLLLVSDKKRNSVLKSKYIKESFVVKDDSKIIDALISNFCFETKAVIFPASDSSTKIIDNNYNLLEQKFIIPNIDKKKGQISHYMDKYVQHDFLVANNIKTAKSFRVALDRLKNEDYKEFPYPIIIKPVVSAHGKKEDIVICENEENIDDILQRFKQNKYNEVLIQEFLDYEIECDISGFCFDKKVCIPGVIEKIRIWPTKTGSTTYGIVKPIEEYESEIIKIKEMLSNLNYFGVFDIEFFIKDGELYLNEINFRNSAISYAYGNSYICYYWYISIIKGEFYSCPDINENYYFIDDLADIHNVLERKIGFLEYRKNLKKSTIRLWKNKKDRSPYKNRFVQNCLKILRIK